MPSLANLVVANLGMILANRSRTRTIVEMLRVPNPAVRWVVGGALFFLGLILVVPFLQDLFAFAPLRPGELMLLVVPGLASVLISESTKLRVLARALAEKT